jgi:tripartite-type tricarboxylate transporter receptor subunit TctC
MSIVEAVGRSVIALIGAALLSAQAMAQAWPDKPIRLIVNFPPGGVADTLARAIAPGVSEMLKQPVVVENRPGANGSIGADAVAKAPPDGYTFLVSSGGAMTVDPFLYPNLPYDTQKDLTPVASLAVVRVFLLVHPSVPAKTLNEFLAYARANPGKLSYGSAGSGSSPHLAGEMMNRAANINATHIPYKGAAPALNDLLGGQVQFMFDPGRGCSTWPPASSSRWVSRAGSARPGIPTSRHSTSSASASTPTRHSASMRPAERLRPSSSG